MFFELNFKSKELGKDTQVNILMPFPKGDDAPPCKTLWLLHGLAGDHTSWMRHTSIERYASEHRIAVIMPNGDRSRYTDTTYGANYFSFVSRELPELCRNTFKQISTKREDNIIAGLSMGGYGALKLALSCPERYGACISLSGSMDITRKGRECNLSEWRSIFDLDMESPAELEGSKHDLFCLSEKLKQDGKTLPRIYMWCGNEDHLIGVNRFFDEHLTKLDIPHVFKTSEGDHSWKWWDLHIQDALRWALNS